MEHRRQDGAPGSLTAVVAERVRTLRTAARLSGSALAAAMNKLGVQWNRTTVAKLETGRREDITLRELLALALVLEVPVISLIADPRPPSRMIPVGGGVEVGPWIALLWLAGLSWQLDDGPEPATYRTAADLIWKGYMIAEMAENLRPKRPGGPRPATQEDIDRIDRSYLATVRQFLDEIKKMGAELPPLPPHVLDRAAELGVKLPGQDGEG